MKLIDLAANQPRQFYRGGALLSSFRGTAVQDEYRPEDWIASTTVRNGAAADEGLTVLPDGRLLRDAVREDPEAWLGPEHAAALGADPALLVKLLDAGERLPVHVHPSRAFAQRHLGCRYGKTEAWIVLEANGADAIVHLGFTRDVEGEELDRWMAAKDTRAMLASLHRLDVKAGDAVLVPAGVPHAIGAGIFCLELQEPTDFSLMLEWDGFDLDAVEARLGMDPELARECVEREALSPARLQALRSHAAWTSGPEHVVERALPDEADAFFRADRVRPTQSPASLEAGFSVLVVLAGDGQLESEHGGRLALRRGSTALIPHAAGAIVVSGPLEAVRCRPPSVQAALDGGLGRAASSRIGAEV